MRGENKERRELDLHLSPERSFVQPTLDDFLAKRERRRKMVRFFDLGTRVPPSKPLGFEMSIHMCGGYLLEFLDCHIRVGEGGVMTVNLPHKRIK